MPTLDGRRQAPPDIIAWADLIAQPWLNGGGVTRQILSRALTASGDWVSCLDDWDWRLSIADVDSAGAFSDFTGMTRVLTVIEGGPITLTVDGVDEKLEQFRPFRFDGGTQTSAQLPHGPIRDLNLIARTGRVNADVRIEVLAPHRPLIVGDGQFCVLVAGHAELRTDGDTAVTRGVDVADPSGVVLHLFDTVVGASAHSVSILGAGTVAVITVSTVSAAA